MSLYNTSPNQKDHFKVQIEIQEKKACTVGLKIEGKIVRGIKPPVFGGECTETLKVYNPSLSLGVPYKRASRQKNDLFAFYLWQPGQKAFVNLGTILGLETDTTPICIKKLIFK